MAAAERAGRLLVVGLVLRFWPEYVELRRIAASGELGRPLAASAQRLSPPPGWNDWMIDPARSGGVCVDLMVHDFDALSAVLGPPRRVFARALRSGPYGAAQHCHAVVEHDGGEAIVEGGLMQPDSYPFSSNLRVLCERGVVEYPFSAAPAADGGNIGGVDQAANRLRVHPADGPMRLVEVVERRSVGRPGRSRRGLAGARRGPDGGDGRTRDPGPARRRWRPTARSKADA